MTRHIKRMVNNCHLPELAHEFSNVENGMSLLISFIAVYFYIIIADQGTIDN